ncbi:UNVERIFIED_CONTAM: cytochrome oxidase c subunit VIb, putative [Hammondia hammondi]|eukprot:XP_008884888.1 cytochrome oxidase c subunit VIb, putative [Hammondia hammondi]
MSFGTLRLSRLAPTPSGFPRPLCLLRRCSSATLPFFVVKMTDSNANPALKFQRSVEELTSQNPHTDDPRSMQFNQMNTCSLRYAMFARCAKELGDDHTRCKYQFYRAQVACPIEQIELWEDYRQKGTCHFDLLPEFSTRHMWQ